MPRFKYHAVDKSGKPKSGEHKAQDRAALLDFLRGQGLTALSVDELEETDAPPPKAAKPDEEKPRELKAARPSATTAIILGTGVNRRDITVLTRQLATTLHAGLPLLRIIHVLHRESTNPKLKGVLENLGQSLQKGASFSGALSDHPKIFDEMYINMVKVGEMGGSLSDCMSRLALMMEKEMTLRRKLKSAMAYPSFILIFTTIMTYALVAFMMPMFIPMFQESGLNIERDYPLTNYLMMASDFATSPVKMGAVVVLGVLLFLAYRVISNQPQGKLALDYAKLKLPFMSDLIGKVVAARFSRSFSLLLKSGVPLIEALRLVAGAAGNEAVAVRLRKVGRNIQEGETISKTLKEAELFPDLLIQMSTMGEEAGSLPDMLERVADYYDEEVDSAVSAMTALLEPAMMVIIGGVVGMFVMGVLLPILGVSTAMQQQMQ
ncbi:MAG: type II secretion system F family protein [Vulcanimicrobiota bacterium]